MDTHASEQALKKPEGLRFSLGGKLKDFLDTTVATAKTEIGELHTKLVVDDDLNQTEKNALRDVGEMATQQLDAGAGLKELEALFKEMRLLEEQKNAEKMAEMQSRIGALWAQMEQLNAPPPLRPPEAKEPEKEPEANAPEASEEELKEVLPLPEMEAEPADEPLEASVEGPLPEEEAEPVPPHVATPEKAELQTVQAYLEQADKEIGLLQKRIPTLKGMAYNKAVQRLADLSQYADELERQEEKLKGTKEEPFIIERGGAEIKTPDVPAGRKSVDEELTLTKAEAKVAETALVDWGSMIEKEAEQLEAAVAHAEDLQKAIQDFQGTDHANKPLTQIEQQYLRTLETELATAQARGLFLQNTIEAMETKEHLSRLSAGTVDQAAREKLQAKLAELTSQKGVLEAALVTALATSREARSIYDGLMTAAGVEVTTAETTHEEEEDLERAERFWGSGSSLESVGGRDIGTYQSGPREKEIITLQGGPVEQKQEEGFLKETTKKFFGWLKNLFT